MEYVWQIIGTREGTGAFPEGQQPQQRELRKSLKSISWPLFSPLAASPHSSAQEMDGQQPWVAVEEGFLREWEAKTVLSAKQRDIAHRLLLQHAEFCPDDVETFQREGLPQAPPALVTNAAAPSSTDEHIREERDEASVAAYSEESGGRGGGEENDTEEAMQRIYAWLDAIAEAGETEKAADFGLKVADIVDNRNWCKQLEDEIEEVLRFIATKRKECGSITDPQTAEQLKQACEQQFFAYNSDEVFVFLFLFFCFPFAFSFRLIAVTNAVLCKFLGTTKRTGIARSRAKRKRVVTKRSARATSKARRVGPYGTEESKSKQQGGCFQRGTTARFRAP
ncbi:hypothetical protein QOT17_017097 [Balamuthia mandrillaris]